MERLRLAISCALSALIHLALLFLLPSWMALSPSAERLGSGGALLVELVPAGGERAAAPPADVAPDVEPIPPPPPPARAAPPPRPKALPPRAPQVFPRVIDGVRVATAEDVRHYGEKERKPAAAPAPPEAPAAAPQADVARAEPAAIGPAPAGPGSAGTVDGSAQGTSVPDATDDTPYKGPFVADSPGYNGRMFAQVSVASSAARDHFYGRIHLFREDDELRDYSSSSLFGFSFRQRLGEAALREFETGRVTTPGAYLAVTDLFADGHYSTMSHTVVFAFPRRPPAGGSYLYDVVEEANGDFRLRAPGGAFLVFDGQSGALREGRGFVISPQGESGTPPRIAYRGLHLRLQAVGSNPFLRDRPATAVDAAGRECELSTSELFSYAGRRESDVFRFKSDGDFFKFLRRRCADLELPEPAPTLVAKAEPKPPPEPKAEHPSSEGLLPLLLRGFH